MYSIQPGEIKSNILYKVAGTKTVLYDGNSYTTGQTFRGVQGITTFSYSGTGTETLNELTEIYAGGLIFEMNYSDREFPFEETGIKGMTLVLDLTEAEKIVQEKTEIKGMSITVIDFPFYAFQWTETRFN